MLFKCYNKKFINPFIFIILILLLTSCVSSPIDNQSLPLEATHEQGNIEIVNASLFEQNSENESFTNTSDLGDTHSKIQENATLTINYIDVGQAESIFIELPNKQTMLIDAGNNEDDEIVINYIKNLNYDTINYVIGTHPHEDHIGGLDTVINVFNIENIYMPKVQHNTATFEDVLIAIQDKGLKINTAKAGVNILSLDNLSIDIIAPVNEEYSNLNDYSAVIKVTYGENSFLFMGDAETLSENEITADVKADVLKVGHHGSSTSTSREFLSKVKPTYAIVLVGKDNSYGHPSNDVLALLNEFYVNVFRTDEQGTIIARSNGEKILINREPSLYETNTSPETQPVITDTPKIIESTPVIEEPVIVKETPVIEEPKEVTVYITKTGAKYHTGGCRYLSKSKIAISLKDAKSSYGACSVCNPTR